MKLWIAMITASESASPASPESRPGERRWDPKIRDGPDLAHPHVSDGNGGFMPRCDILCVNMQRTQDTLAAATADRGVPDRDTEPSAVDRSAVDEAPSVATDRIDDALEECSIRGDYVSVEGLVRATEHRFRYR